MRHAAPPPTNTPRRCSAVRQLTPFREFTISSSRGRRNNTVWAGPSEPGRGTPSRPVLSRHKPPIADPVEHREDRRIVHLALIGLVPRGHRRHLDMPDIREGGLEPVAEVAAHNLGVIKIELYAHVGPVDRANDG